MPRWSHSEDPWDDNPGLDVVGAELLAAFLKEKGVRRIEDLSEADRPKKDYLGTTQGLDKVDVAILSTLVTKFGGGPVGLSTLAAAVGEETETIEDVYEPYLLQLGFLKRTPRGRVATMEACRHLGIAHDGALPLA